MIQFIIIKFELKLYAMCISFTASPLTLDSAVLKLMNCGVTYLFIY